MTRPSRPPLRDASRPPPETDIWHRFIRDREIWAVARRTGTRTRKTGLYFRRKGETRFLPFTRGALPSDRELETLGPEVLCTLLQRAGP